MLLSVQSRASAVSAIVLATSFFFLIRPALQDPLGVLFWYYLLMPVAAGACMGMFPFLSKRFGQVMDGHGHSVLWVGSVATGAVFVGASVFVSFADEAWVDCLVAQDHTGTGTLIVFLLLTMGVATWATFTGLVHRTLPHTWTATRSFIAGLAFVSAALAPVFFALLVFQAAEVATAQIQCSPEIIEGLSQLKKGSVVL
ncbi:MAG: hypothetical protein OXC98_07920 [bacterium]|nr:hypothetical protein [Acidimicrobiia bacterium]MCY4650282.1 hypothetical protein [bacterium]